jgi:serine protease
MTTDSPQGYQSPEQTSGGGGTPAGPGGTGDGGRDLPEPPPLVWGDVDPPMPPASILNRYGARVLDPATALRLPGQRLRPAAYVSDVMLIPLSLIPEVQANGRVGSIAGRLGFTLETSARSLQAATRLRDSFAGNDPVDPAVSVRLVPNVGLAERPNAWTLLQNLRNELREEDVRDRLSGAGCDHIVPAVRPPSQPAPMHEGGMETPSTSGYILNGRTRVPVAVALPAPERRPDSFFEESADHARPVVAVLDTGCGRHPWLDEAVVKGAKDAFGETIGDTDPATDPEVSGDVTGPLDGSLDWVAGHGTFAAGLVHQACPDALVLSIRVIHADGVILERELNHALQQLLTLATLHARGQGGQRIDVVSLSLGYYHETAEDALHDAPLRRLLDGFARLGIPVVAAAGNDSTLRPLFPSAFAPPGWKTSDPVVPVVSVGAENPDGSISLFSNSGEWVSTWAPGALVLSTLPTTMNAGRSAPAELVDPAARRRRADVDPDGYSSGFGLWSGTSFATPLVAGRIAHALLEGSLSGRAPLKPVDPPSTVARARAAVGAVIRQSR